MSEDFGKSDSGAKTRERTWSHADDDLGDLFSCATRHLDRTFDETWQRLAMFGSTIVPASTDAWVNGYQVVKGGERLAFDDDIVRQTLKQEVVDLELALGVGDARAVAYGCDLTKGYIEENAAYYSS